MARLVAPGRGRGSSSTSGLVRSFGYYTGAVFQVYDPAYGVPRSAVAVATTSCSGSFGRPLPAVGFALNVERLHIALTGEESDPTNPGRR